MLPCIPRALTFVSPLTPPSHLLSPLPPSLSPLPLSPSSHSLLPPASHVHDGLFASRRCVSEWAVEGYRVSQMAYILNNLNTHSPSLTVLASHHGVLKFLLLASQCCLPDVSSSGMDTLISLAPFLSLPPSSPSPLPFPLTIGSPLELLFHCMSNSILSKDRMIVLKGMYTLRQLSAIKYFALQVYMC